MKLVPGTFFNRARSTNMQCSAAHDPQSQSKPTAVRRPARSAAGEIRPESTRDSHDFPRRTGAAAGIDRNVGTVLVVVGLQLAAPFPRKVSCLRRWRPARGFPCQFSVVMQLAMAADLAVSTVI
jgi:hypothetical protein